MKYKKLAITTLAIGAGVATYLIKNRTNKKIADEAIPNFDIDKYLGLWYEIARMDFYWEKDKTNVTARYLRNNDNTIEIINRGFDDKKGAWVSNKGIAKQLKEGIGQFKISFINPISSLYNVIAIDNAYQFALIAGKNTDYLWILSREKTIPDHIQEQFLRKAAELGYDIEKLVWTKHNEK